MNNVQQILDSCTGDKQILDYVISILESSRTKNQALRRIIGLKQTRENILDVIITQKEKITEK